MIIAEQLIVWIYRSLADNPNSKNLDGSPKMYPEEI